MSAEIDDFGPDRMGRGIQVACGNRGGVAFGPIPKNQTVCGCAKLRRHDRVKRSNGGCKGMLFWTVKYKESRSTLISCRIEHHKVHSKEPVRAYGHFGAIFGRSGYRFREI